MIEVVVHNAPTEREAAPLLLDVLRERNPDKADWIEDVFSEVLKGLRQNDIKDPEMVRWLMEAIFHAFQTIASPETHFVRHGDVYGYVSLASVKRL